MYPPRALRGTDLQMRRGGMTPSRLALLVAALASLIPAEATVYSTMTSPPGQMVIQKGKGQSITYSSDSPIQGVFIASITQGTATLTSAVVVFNGGMYAMLPITMQPGAVGPVTITLTPSFGQDVNSIGTLTFTSQIYDSVDSTLTSQMIVTGTRTTVTVTLGSASTVNFEMTVTAGTAAFAAGTQLQFVGTNIKTFDITPSAMGTLTVRLQPSGGADQSNFGRTFHTGNVKDPLVMISNLATATLVKDVESIDISARFQYPETAIFDLAVISGELEQLPPLSSPLWRSSPWRAPLSLSQVRRR